MQLTDEPATEMQISTLRKFGYQPDHPLSRGEAAQILMNYQHAPAPVPPEATPPHLTPHHPHYLRKCVEEVKLRLRQASPDIRDAVEQEYQSAVSMRQEFWIDTCREMTQMQLAWPEIRSLYQVQGCRFATPNREQTQEVLDALDAALTSWDKDYPQIFYQTLELNFPQLLQVR